MSKSLKILPILLIFLLSTLTSGCIGDSTPVNANNSTVTYTTSENPTYGNFWMYMYLMHSFDSRDVVYVEQNHYYSTHPASSPSKTKITDVKAPTKKESFVSKASGAIKSESKKVGTSFKASKSGFKSSSSYKSSSFKSSRSGFGSSRSSFRSSHR